MGRGTMQSKSSLRAMERADRDERILQLRRDPANYSLQEIGDIVGASSMLVCMVVKKHIRAVLDKEAGETLAHELEKLDQIERDAMTQAFNFRAQLDSDGKVIYEPMFFVDGKPATNSKGEPLMTPRRDWDVANQGKAILLKVHEKRAKLLGLEAPTKVQQLNDPASQVKEITFSIVDKNGVKAELPPCNPAEEPESELPEEVEPVRETALEGELLEDDDNPVHDPAPDPNHDPDYVMPDWLERALSALAAANQQAQAQAHIEPEAHRLAREHAQQAQLTHQHQQAASAAGGSIAGYPPVQPG